MSLMTDEELNTEPCTLIREQRIRELALEQHCSNYYSDHSYPEIEDDAKVSEGEDNGAYVQAWVWVDFTDTELDKGETEADRIINEHLSRLSDREKPAAGE